MTKDLLVLLNQVLEQVKDRTCQNFGVNQDLVRKRNEEYGNWAVTSQDAKYIMTIIQNEGEKNKEVYITPIRGIKATWGSKSTKQKINRRQRRMINSARVDRISDCCGWFWKWLWNSRTRIKWRWGHQEKPKQQH